MRRLKKGVIPEAHDVYPQWERPPGLYTIYMITLHEYSRNRYSHMHDLGAFTHDLQMHMKLHKEKLPVPAKRCILAASKSDLQIYVKPRREKPPVSAENIPELE